MRTYLLFCPGPVNISDSIRKAFSSYEVGHRETEFSHLYEQLQRNILKLFEIKDTKNYQSVVITGSGSAANETVLSSIIGEKNLLVLANGEFGERLYELSCLHNPNTHLIRSQWGEPINLRKVRTYLKTHKIDAVCMVHHETSTGMLNPIEKVGKIAKNHRLLFFVDAISSAGSERLQLEKCNITFLTASSSKGIGSYPGLSFVTGEKTAFVESKNVKVKTSYFNLYKHYTFATSLSQTPNTPAVSLFFALNQALVDILSLGLLTHYKNIAKRMHLIRKTLLSLDFRYYIDPKDMSSGLTTFLLPNAIDIPSLQSYLKTQGIIIYNGKGPLKNKAIQIATLGALKDDDVQTLITHIKSFVFQKQTKKERNSMHSSLQG